MKPLDFENLRTKNAIRCRDKYHDIFDWTPTDWACAVAGETGEMCNFVKKLKRLDSINFNKTRQATDVTLQPEELIENIGKELADIVIYCDLLAQRLNLNLGTEVIKKFNLTSDKIQSNMKL